MAFLLSFCKDSPLGSNVARMRYTFPVMASPLGKVAFEGGATGSSVRTTDVWPAGAAIARPNSSTLACESRVANSPSVTEPFLTSSVKRPERGGLLMDARFDGGLTQRYGAGGANPSRRGRR